jgi:hypothetical protein
VRGESGHAVRARARALVAAALALCACAGAVAGASASSSAPGVAAALKKASAPASELKRTRTISFRGVKIVRYEQEVEGLPVLGGDAAVLQPPGEAARLLTDETAANVSVSAPTVASSRAISIAQSATGARPLRASPQVSLAVDPRHGGALVQRVVLPSLKPLKDFEVLVDASSGRVLSQRNLLQYATGQAKLYTPNPVAWNGGYSGIGTTGAADHHDNNTQKLTALRKAVTLHRLSSRKRCLIGKYVNALLGRKANRVCRESRNWRWVKRADNRFEALMAYYHIDQIQSYIRSLGFTGTADVHPRRQTVIADAMKADQSFYRPSDRKIRFGQGGADDAEDGDVVVHEYGHAIQDAQDPGFGITLGAASLGEGFGDFVSALNTAITPGIPNYGASEYCVFDWDGVVGYGGSGVAPCGRVVNGSDGINTLSQANAACGNDPHCFGEVWAGGLIDLMNSLPLDANGDPPIVIDTLLSQFAYADSESFSQAVNALISADNAVYGGVHNTAICNEMKGQRGIGGTVCP